MKEDAVKFLEALLNIPSVNGRDDESAVAEYLSAYFKEHGIESRVQRIDGTHANVLAFIEGEDTSETSVWNGHLDTVPYGSLSQWNTEPGKVTETDGKLYARGASDMKSGLAAMAYALSHLGKKPKTNIQFIGTCDEEKGGLGAERALSEKVLPEYRFLLIGEPTGMRLGTAHKGCLWLKIQVKGKTGHGAYPEKGVNAIHYLYRLAEEIKAYVYGFQNPVLGSATAQIDMINGGVAPNMTADLCEAVMDIRMVPGLTTEMILAHGKAVLSALQQEAPQLSAEFTAQNDRRAFEISDEEPEVKTLRALLKAHGFSGENIGINFFTDASVLARTELSKKVLLFGPGDPALAHQPNEFVETEKYLKAIEILKEFAVKE